VAEEEAALGPAAWTAGMAEEQAALGEIEAAVGEGGGRGRVRVGGVYIGGAD
jgi:hypothetical protein